MVTLVGTQADFIKALKELLELEYDAAETYEAAIHRIEEKEYKDTLSKFKSDHERHIRDLTNYLESKGEKAPTGPSGAQLLSIGKVAIGKLLGTKSILQAMNDAEEDTNTAYERMTHHKQKLMDCDNILKRGWEDEKRHKKWVETTIDKIK